MSTHTCNTGRPHISDPPPCPACTEIRAARTRSARSLPAHVRELQAAPGWSQATDDFAAEQAQRVQSYAVQRAGHRFLGFCWLTVTALLLSVLGLSYRAATVPLPAPPVRICSLPHADCLP